MPVVQFRDCMPSVDLICYQTDKFKNSLLSVVVASPLDAKTASMNAASFKVISKGSIYHSSIQDLAIALENIGDASISPINFKIGDWHCLGLLEDFPECGLFQDSFRSAAELLAELMLYPATNGGLFRENIVQQEKELMLRDIAAQKNNRTAYAYQLMLEKMLFGEPHAVNNQGSIEGIKRINRRSLTRHWQNLISSSPVEFHYIGPTEPELVYNIITEAFSGLPRRNCILLPEHIISRSATDSVFQIVKKDANINQCRLTAGFRVQNINLLNNEALCRVWNTLWGGGVNSVLFNRLRETQSLCYSVNSLINRKKGFTAVCAGVDSADAEQFTDLMLMELDGLKKQLVSDDLLASAKNSVLSFYSSIADSPYTIESRLLDFSFTGLYSPPESQLSLTSAVSKNDINEMALAHTPDTLHYLCRAEEFS